MSDLSTRAVSIADVLAQQESVLSSAEVAALARRIEQGDTAARETLIIENLRLVARALRGERADRREDLFQDGVAGLIRAVELYDWRKRLRFSTYAMFWIRRSMEIGRHAIRDNPLTVPERAWGQLQTVRALDYRCEERGEERLSIAELSIKAAITPGQAEALRAVPDGLADIDELTEVPDESVPLADVAIARARASAVHAALNDLDPVARSVIALRTGIEEPAQSLRAIARQIGLSHERVRIIEREAYARLAPALEAWRD